MIEQIGAFAGKRLRIALDRRDHHFDRLFAEFFGGASRPPIEKRFRVGGSRCRLRSRGNNRGQIVESEAAHEVRPRLPGLVLAEPALAGKTCSFSSGMSGLASSRTGSPKLAIYCLAWVIVNSPK